MKGFLFLLSAVVVAAPVSAKTYAIDPMHSAVGFTVRHLGVSKVHGAFTKVSGTVEYEEGKPKSWKAVVELDPASIDTHVDARDKHLRSKDFFDVERCPKMTFKSTKVEVGEDGKAGKLYGELTMRCVTKPVVLGFEVGGEAADPKGGVHFGASATGKVNRRDWGVGESFAAKMVGDDVDLSLDVEAVPAAEKK